MLCYRPSGRNQQTVRRHYAKWREERGLPPRCDKESCAFYSRALEWNGEPLPLTMDHKNGNRFDNSPGNLRLLCPNCDSQLLTRGGANRGRVEVRAENSYVLRSRDGRRDHHVIPGPARITVTDHVVAALISDTSE